MLDDNDMYRQCCVLYGQANMLARKFKMCSDHVKINLFQKEKKTPAHCQYLQKKSSLMNFDISVIDLHQVDADRVKNTTF